jgi:hypothetical protein
MKISSGEFQKVCRRCTRKESARRKCQFTQREIRIIKEIIRQMPDNAIRHLDYNRLRREYICVPPENVAEKFIMRNLVDFILDRD